LGDAKRALQYIGEGLPKAGSTAQRASEVADLRKACQQGHDEMRKAITHGTGHNPLQPAG
jgi:hypothetical protein